MAKKQKLTLSNRQIFLLTSIILVVGILMLTISILFAPQPPQPTQTSILAEQKKQEEQKITKNQEDTPKSDTSKTDTGKTQSSENTSTKSDGNVSSSETSRTQATQETKRDTSSTITTPVVPKEEPAIVKNKNGKLIIVFDDAGHNMKQLTPFLNLPFPSTIAVLPSLASSTEAANAIRKAGKELILHQPMQAVNLSVDPGPSSIQPGMYSYEIEEVIRENLAQVGSVKGMNNHEGSLITATQSAIGVVLDVCNTEGIYFLDSRTNSESKAKQAAAERGIAIYERDIFLDNTPAKKDILEMLQKGLDIADKKGYVIMIGHVWSDNLASILTEQYPKLIAQGYTFTTISSLNK